VSDRWLGLRRPPLIAATALYAVIWALIALPRAPVPLGWLSPLCFLLGFALMQWLTGVLLDANWAGALVAGSRVYPLQAYRAAFTLCFGVASVSFLMAWLTTETRCRNVWTQAHPHA
jgi:biotin transporter BioY